MAHTNKIHSDNDFARRVKALGLTYVELAELSGYSPKTLYNISCNKGVSPAPLNAYIKILEVLADMNQLDTVLKAVKEK